MRIVLGLLVLVVGCGGKASDSSSSAPTAGAGGIASAGGTASVGRTAGAGGTAGATADAGAVVDAGAAAGADAQAGGGSAGQSCDELKVEAQRAADTSCEVDSDCSHPPHMAGDCTECGVLLNAATEESSLAAVQAVCKPFFAQGCKLADHSCPYEPAVCDAGVCAFGDLLE